MWFLLLAEEDGQDLVEYALLLAFLCIAGAAAYLGIGGSIDTIWNIVNNRLTQASE